MMGALGYEPSSRSGAWRYDARWGAVLVVGSLLLWTSSTLAAEPAHPIEPAAAQSQAVSTSPVPPKVSPMRVVATQAPPRRPSIPLTRAAAREQLESVSPVHWLTRFGRVDIQPRD